MDINVYNNIYNDENTYILSNDANALVIDPGADAEKIITLCGNKKIKYIFLTHCHYDHIGAVTEIEEKTGAGIYCTAECADNIKNIDVSLTEAGLGKKLIIEKTSGMLEDNEEFDFDGEKIKVIKTPGHTSCSTCFLWRDNLFSGDTLFLRSVGRWDLPTGNFDKLKKSITEKIYTLKESVNVYPGHGDKTTIEYEKKFNMCIGGE